MERRSRLPATLSDDCRRLLGPERAEVFERLMDQETGSARELMVMLRDDPEFGTALARCDTVDRLGELFSEAEGQWAADADRSGPLGAAAFGVAWTFSTVHDKSGAFNHLPATHRDVQVRGFTILGIGVDDRTEAERLVVRRYVDWAGVFGQLGLTLNWRVPVPPDRVATRGSSGQL
jgi:hypothetical protein